MTLVEASPKAVFSITQTSAVVRQVWALKQKLALNNKEDMFYSSMMQVAADYVYEEGNQTM
jgi:hypothetical protein